MPLLSPLLRPILEPILAALLTPCNPPNLLRYSEQFDNAVWTPLNLTIGADATVAPDGTTTADKLQETAASGLHRARQSYTLAADATLTLSVYLKAAERTFGFLEFRYPNTSAYIDLTTGAVSTPAGTGVFSAVAAGNGWWRLIATQACTAGANDFAVHACPSSGTVSYLGVAGSGIYAWGAQLVAGPSAGAYQRTV